jgi:hypothetical protein
MTTRGRGSSRRAGTTDSGGTSATEPVVETGPVPASAFEPAAELLDEQTTTIAFGRAGSRAGVRLGRSLAGGVAGTLLIAGLAFGAALGPGGALGPKLTDHATATAGEGSADGGDAAHARTGDAPDATDKPEATDKPQGGGEGAGAPDATEAPGEAGGPDEAGGDEAGGDEAGDGETGAEPTEEPAPDPTRKPEPRPEPKPAVTALNLELWIADGRPVMEWSACEGFDFDYYKVVRSTDPTVSWPLGEHDSLIAVVERGGNRKAWDNDAPRGRKDWYRVFCVRHTDDGYKVLGSSDARGIQVPEAPTPPDPISLELGASINDEGHVTLSWSACNVDGFGAYKVLRSTSTEEPSYLPYHDGTDVIGVVENEGATQWYDAGGDPGQTVYYRVQCIGWINGGKVLLGQTAVVAVTMP